MVKIMTTTGIALRRPGPAKKLDAQAEADVAAQYRDGVPIQEIVRTHGISKPLLYRTLERLGVPFNKRSSTNENPAALTGAPGDVNPEGGLHVQSDDTTLPDAEGNGTSEEV